MRRGGRAGRAATRGVSPGALRRIAGKGELLVACDFDGTLAPIAEHPDAARADRDALAALERLARLPATHAAVISGRARDDLRVLVGPRPGVQLVGSHGAESGGPLALSPGACALRGELLEALGPIARGFEGAYLEPKPTGAAFHYRRVPAARKEEAEAAVLDGPARRSGVVVRRGHEVVELLVVETNKGEALDRLRDEMGVDAALFVGDDRTDEDAFARLRGDDLGVKVGPGETLATARVRSQADVAPLLERLAELREAVSAGGAPRPP